MTQPRLIQPGAIYLVTRRVVGRHHLFAPDPRMKRIFLYTLAVAAARTGVRVHCAVLMSTHEHLVVSDPDGRLPEFLHYLHRHVAMGTKSLRRWEGAVWDHEPTSVVELRTPSAIIEKVAYAIANPVAAGLVPRAKDWPGVTTRPDELGRATWRIERPSGYFAADDARWPRQVELGLEMPAQLELTDVAFRQLVAEEVAALESAARAALRESGRRFLGADRCAKLSPLSRATSPEPIRDRNPTFAVGRGNDAARRESAERVRAFRSAYRYAREAWRKGQRHVPFPFGTWLMREEHAALIAAA